MGFRNRLERAGLVTPRIFLSYRRSDAGGYAGQLLGALSDRYGDRAVTLDHQSIEAGESFAAALDGALTEAEVLIAVIGPDWVTVEQDGERRLDSPDDWVRREVVTGLERPDVRVLPVLVGDAEVPVAEDLPEALAPLAGLQMTAVRPDRFDDDVAHLVKSIGGWRRHWRGIPVYAWASLVAAVLAITLAGVLVARSGQNAAPSVAVPGPIEVVSGDEATIDILSWTSDDQTEDLAVVVDSFSQENGVVEDERDGTVVYTAARGFQGSDRFAFKVIDEQGLATEGTVFVDVALGPLEGAFNVAVPNFSATGDEASALAPTLSTQVFEQTRSTLESATTLSLEVADPASVGSLAGTSPQERADAAATLADQINANLVLYGTLQSQDDVSLVTLEFYLSERGLTGATELAGAYELGTVERLTSNPAALELALAEFLEPRVAALGQMFVGLAHYQLDDFSAAEEQFLEAERAWPATGGSTSTSNGKETVLQLLGNVAGKQNKLDEARDHYVAALALVPGYPRAQFGLAEVQFQESRGSLCGGSGAADTAQLEDAVAQFQQVEASEPPPLSFLQERAVVEIARINLCLSLNGVDRMEEARADLNAFIVQGAGNARLRNLVGEAHASLGTYHVIKQLPEAAIEEYRLAIESSLDEARRGFFHSTIGDLYACFLDEPELAEAEYAASVALVEEPLARAECAQ